MWDRDTLRGYRTLIFHSLYGVPAAVLMLLDITHEIDITPILERLGVGVADVPLYLSCIAAGSVVLRFMTATPMFHRDDPAAPVPPIWKA